MINHYVVLREPLWQDSDTEVYDDIAGAQAALDELHLAVEEGDEDGEFRIYRIEAVDPAPAQEETAT